MSGVLQPSQRCPLQGRKGGAETEFVRRRPRQRRHQFGECIGTETNTIFCEMSWNPRGQMRAAWESLLKGCERISEGPANFEGGDKAKSMDAWVAATHFVWKDKVWVGNSTRVLVPQVFPRGGVSNRPNIGASIKDLAGEPTDSARRFFSPARLNLWVQPAR